MSDQRLSELRRLAEADSPSVVRWIQELLRNGQLSTEPVQKITVEPVVFTHTYSSELLVVEPFGCGTALVNLPRNGPRHNELTEDFHAVGISLFVSGGISSLDYSSIVRITETTNYHLYEQPLRVLAVPEPDGNSLNSFSPGWRTDLWFFRASSLYFELRPTSRIACRAAIHGSWEVYPR